MASTCILQKGNNFPSTSLSDYGVQPSRLPGSEGVCFSENGEILDSDDSDNDKDEDEDEDDLPSVSEIVAHSRRVPVQTRPPRPVVDLTCNSDDDDIEPPPELAEALIGQPEDLPEIPETPAAAVESVQHEEDNHSDDGKNGPDREIQTPYGASTLPGDRVLEIDGSEPSIRETSPEERDTGTVEATEVQRVDQTESVLDTHCSDESSISVAGTSRQTRGPAAALVSSFPDLGDRNLVMVDISNFTITEIVDKRPGPSGVEYKCEFQPLWWAAESAETAQMGRLKTLRERKRKFSQV